MQRDMYIEEGRGSGRNDIFLEGGKRGEDSAPDD